MFRMYLEKNALDVPIDGVNSANYFEDFLAMISPGRQTLINRGIFWIDF